MKVARPLDVSLRGGWPARSPSTPAASSYDELVPTAKQLLGRRGEDAVHDHVPCPRCNRERHLTALPANFQCADLICKFCGFLAQVKATTVHDGQRPDRILGAAWAPQHEQILAGIYQPLYVVGFSTSGRLVRIDYVPAHILAATPLVFEPRKPLGATAKRAGWTGFNYNLSVIPAIGIKQVYPLAKGRRTTAVTAPVATDAPVRETDLT